MARLALPSFLCRKPIHLCVESVTVRGLSEERGAMNKPSTRMLIRRYVLENFLYTDDEDVLRDDVSFLENGVVDSTGVLELVMFVEDTFGIPVKDEEIVPENFDSVNRLAEYVESQMGEPALITA